MVHAMESLEDIHIYGGVSVRRFCVPVRLPAIEEIRRSSESEERELCLSFLYQV